MAWGNAYNGDDALCSSGGAGWQERRMDGKSQRRTIPRMMDHGFVSLEKSERDCVPHHAVLIAPGLWLASPKNGNISNVGRRLSAISLPSCSNWEYREGQQIHEKPQLAGTYRILRPTISS